MIVIKKILYFILNTRNTFLIILGAITITVLGNQKYCLLNMSMHSNVKLPKLVAFDLDGTVWTPDMYELWGGYNSCGAPFSIAKNGKDLVDNRGVTVRLLGITDRLLHDLREDPKFSSIKIAWVSCTDEPEWADECMSKFKTNPGGVPIKSCADSSQIFKSNKQVHFRNLKKEFPTIEYEEMLFFDNEYGNIQNVKSLGVKCVFCPKGVTQQAWDEGLKLFS